jgi:hypothetical protein
LSLLLLHRLRALQDFEENGSLEQLLFYTPLSTLLSLHRSSALTLRIAAAWSAFAFDTQLITLLLLLLHRIRALQDFEENGSLERTVLLTRHRLHCCCCCTAFAPCRTVRRSGSAG